jgi:hypothetical protein
MRWRRTTEVKKKAQRRRLGLWSLMDRSEFMTDGIDHDAILKTKVTPITLWCVFSLDSLHCDASARRIQSNFSSFPFRIDRLSLRLGVRKFFFSLFVLFVHSLFRSSIDLIHFVAG